MKEKAFRCPVCKKTLTEAEYDQALGLWKTKQEHIKHLEAEQKELKKQKLAAQKEAKKKDEEFKKREAKSLKEQKKILAEKDKQFQQKLKHEKTKLRNALEKEKDQEIKKQVQKEVAKEKKQLNKQRSQLRKNEGKIKQLENNVKNLVKKNEGVIEENKRLQRQLKDGTTPQIEGLLEEKKLLKKLKELFPQDKFEHTGKGGDITHDVIEHRKTVGRIVYECKRVKRFDKKHVEQTKRALRSTNADFAVLVTNAFPSKKQHYFVKKNVFVIHPHSVEPIIHTLRESLVRIAILKMTNEAKEKAVQMIYDYLASNEYKHKMNDFVEQLMELGKSLKDEVIYHKRIWFKRRDIYIGMLGDITSINLKLKGLAQLKSAEKISPKIPKLLAPHKGFEEIPELFRKA